MKSKKYILIVFLILVMTINNKAHIDSYLLPEGCGSCHVGHGNPGQPLLLEAEEEFCYQCHGSDENRSKMVAQGKLAQSAVLADIEMEFKKPYHHPVEEFGSHKATEKLPNFSGARVSHAECVDCHNPHQRLHQKGLQTQAVSGYSLTGQYLETAQHEYDICFKCHTDLAGDPQSAKNIYGQFDPNVRSMHPVTRPAVVISQSRQSNISPTDATMKCSDCHRSDNSDAPRGPHGSNYPFMLSGNYNISGETYESPLEYQFCYSCHDRASILSNQSFPLHREHIEGDLLRGINGTSCYTCHAAHSSMDNPYLINFNREVVSGSQAGNMIKYISFGNNSGQCYLSCHGKSHDPEEY